VPHYIIKSTVQRTHINFSETSSTSSPLKSSNQPPGLW